MQQYVPGVFALVYLGMLFGGLPGLALNRTAVALLGAIALLALSSTLAGNLFLLGSIANLIVAEQAARLGVYITWRRHLRLGLPVTLATFAVTALWL